MARLIVKTDDSTDTVDLNPSQPTGIGRDGANQVSLDGIPGVSRNHCRVTAVPSGGSLAWELTDLGATNKTRVNGKPTEKRVLSSGDVITVGKAEITFEDSKEEERIKEAGAKGVCYLLWVTGDRKGEKVWLEAPRTTLGRRASNTIPLEDRMSSGHHAEISRDLNGYTVRDMGSTNGTLVNGEPLTEATLNHGSRIRIGNSRFVFKDPSMKDIEVELSQFDEDEGWGMMGDIDLTRARGSYLGLLLGLLLLGGAAAGGYFLMQQAENEATDSVTGEANLVANGDMEDEDAVAFLWDTPSDEDPVSIKRTKRGKGFALQLRHQGGDEKPAPVVVSYADEFPALASSPLRVRASVRASGDAALVAVWRNKADAASGATGLTHTISLGTGSVNELAVKPPWAVQVSIGVRLGPGASAVIDDLRVTRESGGAGSVQEIDCPGDPKAFMHPGGGVDIVSSLTVLVVGAAPVARMAEGTVLAGFTPDGPPEASGAGVSVAGKVGSGDTQLPVTIAWTASDGGDGLKADIRCPGAAAVGLDTNLLRAHVGSGVDVVTSGGARSLAATAGEKLDHVTKILAGNPKSEGGRPRTLVTFKPQADPAASSIEILDASDAPALVLRHWTEGTQASVVLVTDYDVESRAAQAALDEAEGLVRRQPGMALEKLREVAKGYPFNERVRNRALQLYEDTENEARKEVDAYASALQAFQIFRSNGTLAALDKHTQALGEKYVSRGTDNGPLENAVAGISAKAAEARAAYYAEHAGAELTRLERLADLLADVEGYQPMAAIFYRTIVDRFGHLEGDDSFGRRVTRARTRFTKLIEDEGIAAAVPKSGK